jgi:methylmalonyl-CoA mutase
MPTSDTTAPYQSKNRIRIISATSLFDGHDAAINVMRRIIQASGAEVIHLGHNRSAQELVNCAIQEDAHALALTSYQGGHVEYFTYIRKLLDERGYKHVRIFGGGGGVILPDEIEALHKAGITRIYSPDDGRSLGLQGMINDLLEKADFDLTVLNTPKSKDLSGLSGSQPALLARLITLVENGAITEKDPLRVSLDELAAKSTSPVLGITGTGGAGKSSLIDEFVRRFTTDFPDKTIAILSVDPSKRKTGGALLGDRIRMNSIDRPNVYMRSLATRQSNLALSKYVKEALLIMKAAKFDLILLETSGIGQSDTEIIEHSDVSLYVMTPEYGAATQLEKIDMIDFADVIAINKFDRKGALDALRDVRKQYRRSRTQFTGSDDELPVHGSIASQFNDPGMTRVYRAILRKMNEKKKTSFASTSALTEAPAEKTVILPGSRNRYLSEISDTVRSYNKWVDEQAALVDRLQALETAERELAGSVEKPLEKSITERARELESQVAPENLKALREWPAKKRRYEADEFSYPVRGKEVRVKTFSNSLSGTKIPKVVPPRLSGAGDLLRFLLQENLPGEFPYTAGSFPFKRENEDPTRMFAGEGGPERTNRRFHYVSEGMPAHRLSTAFDSVTLYGEDPELRPDIYGKIGNSGVSVCTLDDAKKLYSGFDLCDPKTSVSMTINGPAPLILGFFMNAAIDQQCERYIHQNGLEKEVRAKIAEIYKKRGVAVPRYQGELPRGNNGLGLLLLGVTGDEVLPAGVYAELKQRALSSVRGTVQADILKEDQAQNTCIFSTEFALRLMGDVQEYFTRNDVRNFYSVSISGYHIAEAGANPISQLAFTLSNGFTLVEYYLSRGLKIDEFAPNLSFFFSNGLDPEYAVIGRVARRLWAKALKIMYKGAPRSQMLKYHIQTSGRSLHAQEISFNDIRTTLQALYALADQCNSLHTNAYDEAITTPTEESVRRAMAIQLIINHELGMTKTQNPWQGAYLVEYLTDLVEEAVLAEFDRLTERGGVLGAMETMYQRGKIQEESLHYEMLKHTGELPLIGVNTFLSKEGSPTVLPAGVIRSTEEEKHAQIAACQAVQKAQAQVATEELEKLKLTAVQNRNVFEAILGASKRCTLGQMTHALYSIGGKYRRNM